MRGLKDPSLPKNITNGFNVGECYSLVPVEIILILPNLGYGFLANMYGTTRYDGLVQVIPTPNGVSITELKYNSSSAFQYDLDGIRVFTPHTGYTDSMMITSIPLNQPCQGEGTPRRNLELPIPIKLKLSTDGSETEKLWNTTVQATYTGYASLWTAKQVADNISSNPTDLEYLYAGIALEVMRAIDVRDTEEGRNDRWTGQLSESIRRIEYPHLSSIGETPEEIIANGFTDGEDAFGKTFSAPCVLAAIQGEDGLRLYYSSTLNDTVMRTLQVVGKSEPPIVTSKIIPYPVGAPSDLLPDSVPVSTAEYSSVVNSLTSIEYEILTHRSGPHNISGLYNLRPVNNMHQISNSVLETKSANLYTQYPPFITNKDIIGQYSDTRGFETLAMFDKESFTKPIIGYADSNTEYTKCYCYNGKVGIDYCFRCNSSGWIPCPVCNTPIGITGDSVGYIIGLTDNMRSYCETCNADGKGERRGYIECPDCNGTGNGVTETCPVCNGSGLSYKSFPSGNSHPVELKVEIRADADYFLITQKDMPGILADDLSVFYDGTVIPRTVTSLNGTTQTVWDIDDAGKTIRLRRGAVYYTSIPVFSNFKDTSNPVFSNFKVYYVLVGVDDTADSGFKYFSDVEDAPIVSSLELTGLYDAFWLRGNKDEVTEVDTFKKNEGFNTLAEAASDYESIMKRVIGIQSNPNQIAREFAVFPVDMITDERLKTDEIPVINVTPDTLTLTYLDNMNDVDSYDGIMIGPDSDYGQIFTGFSEVYPLISYTEFAKMKEGLGMDIAAQNGISVDAPAKKGIMKVAELISDTHITSVTDTADYGKISVPSILDNAITRNITDPRLSIATCRSLFSEVKALSENLERYIKRYTLGYGESSPDFGNIESYKEYAPSPEDIYSVTYMEKDTSALTSSVCDIKSRAKTVKDILSGDGEVGISLDTLNQKLSNAASDIAKITSLLSYFREKGEADLLTARSYFSAIVNGTLGSDNTSATYLYLQSTDDDGWYLMSVPDSYGMGFGFFFYNIRKLYTLIISIAAYCVALIDRIIIRLVSLEKSFTPYWYSSIDEVDYGLGISLFESFNRPVYPNVNSKALSDGSFDKVFETEESGMFAISQLFKEGLLYYDYHINIPPITIDTCRGIALCGLGTGEELSGFTAQDAQFSTLDTDEDDFTEINAAFQDIQSVVGIKDYLKRDGGSVTFTNKAGEAETVSIPTDVEVGNAIAKGSGYNHSVSFTPQKIKGKIDVGKVFPYINSLSIDRSNIFDAQIEFKSGQPSTVETDYNALVNNGTIISPVTSANAGTILQDRAAGENEAVRVAKGIAASLQDSIMLSQLYSIGTTFGDTGVIDNSLLIPFVGSTDPAFTPSEECDSSLVALTLGKDPSNDDILGYNQWNSDTATSVNRMNYNLYLSKRRSAFIAQWVLHMLTTGSGLDSVDSGVIKQTGQYNVRIVATENSTTPPTLTSGEYAFRAFRCNKG